MGKRKDELFKENYDFNKDIGLLLYKYRKKHNLSQSELGKIVSTSSNTISQTELGNRTCNLYNMYLYTKTLNIPLNELINILYDKKYLPYEIKGKIKKS